MDPDQGSSLMASSATRSRGNSASQQPSSGRRTNVVPLRAPLISNNSSVRIRRLTSSPRPHDSGASDASSVTAPDDIEDTAVTGRRRSSSAPQRMTNLTVPGSDLGRQTTNEPYHPAMPVIQERPSGGIRPAAAPREGSELHPAATTSRINRPRGLSDLHTAGSGVQATVGAGNAARLNRGLSRLRSNTVRSRPPTGAEDEYDNDMLGFLDLVDPEVQTLGTLTNVQNSLFVPDLGRLINRRPVYDLSSRPSTGRLSTADGITRTRAGTIRPRTATASTTGRPPTVTDTVPEDGLPELARKSSISSQMTDRHFAVLPHGETLEGWTDEDIAELNDHVRHLMHSRREGFKRSWRGFKQYISKPLGLFVFVYAVLVTLFGATWVIFLIGWIYVGSDRQNYAIDVIDNVLVALFALMGDGLAPFRAVDTYHMCFIAHFHHLTWKLRNQRDMPKLADHNDLPARRLSAVGQDLEAGEDMDDLIDHAEFSVLTPLQQRRLQYHQAKFSKSHTFYRPHETATHHAFPLRLLVAVVVLLDFHSLFQVALGTCTWSIDYRVRPEALTATILSCSITCNIAAGVLVSIGDKRTRKKEVLEKINRQNLTREAIENIQKKHREHERLNYAALEAEQSGHQSENSKNKAHGRFSLDLYRNEGHRPSKDIPRITTDVPRVSKDLPRLAEDVPASASATKTAST